MTGVYRVNCTGATMNKVEDCLVLIYNILNMGMCELKFDL